MNRMLTVAVLAVALTTSTARADFTINLNPSANMSQESQDGFRAAADFWESQLIDDVEVNLDIDFRTLEDPRVLGSARSFKADVLVADYFSNLTTDATSQADFAAIANLPTLGANGSIAFRTQTNTESTIASTRAAISLDNDTSGLDATNNRFLSVNRANLKAVGLPVADSAGTDASITFNASFDWDFDRTDGINSGDQDFVGVAIHEIGHALGFVSGVDIVDFAIDRGFDLDRSEVFSAWDMFRYSSNDGILDLSVGTDSYFSLDGGETNLAFYSTGSANGGDGRQASHWKDSPRGTTALGIMDPTAAAAGELNIVTDLDLLAFDVMGWDLATTAVPEPSSGLLLGSIIGLIALRRKRSASC